MSLYKPKAERMLQVSGVALQQVEKFKYLGVVFSGAAKMRPKRPCHPPKQTC